MFYWFGCDQASECVVSVFNDILYSKSFTVKVALHLRWLTTEKFQNYKTVKG